MTKTLKDLGINFSRKHIATNGNFYRVAKPTEEFWAWYKENKASFKEAGYSVYKHDDYGFCVYDWTNKEKATDDEKTIYEAEKIAYDKERLQCAVEALRGYVEDRSNETVADCSTWEEFDNELACNFDNVEYVWNEYIIINIPVDFYFSE